MKDPEAAFWVGGSSVENNAGFKEQRIEEPELWRCSSWEASRIFQSFKAFGIEYVLLVKGNAPVINCKHWKAMNCTKSKVCKGFPKQKNIWY